MPETPAQRQPLEDAPRPRARPGLIAAWCAYDWGSSAPPAIIISFVFASYFTQEVAANETLGTALWGNMLSLSGIAIAVTSLLIGPAADAGAGCRFLLALFTGISAIAGCLLWGITPSAEMVVPALALCFLVNLGLEVAMVFYNVMLPTIAPPRMIGRVSGWGWGIGYIGAIVCLALALLLVWADPPPLGLDAAALEPVRATSPLASLWMLVFALPLLIVAPRTERSVALGTAMARGVQQSLRSVRLLRNHRQTARFLLAHILYRDGINTLFAFGGVYAAGTFGMTTEEILMFGVALYVVAGVGAFGFAWVDDRIGSKRTILVSLAGMIAFGLPLLLVATSTGFFVFGLALSIFFGPAQSASRSLMSRLTPEGHRGQMFGLFALSGRIISPLGPLLVGWITLAADSQRVGMATILVFFVVGGAILLGVREPSPADGDPQPRPAGARG